MELPDALRALKAKLHDAHGRRFRGVVLFGSEARGEARPDSDVDLLVLLQGPVELVKDLDASIRAVYPIQLEIERPIHLLPVDCGEYEARGCALYRAIHQEGISL